jgi:hypothetical protein
LVVRGERSRQADAVERRVNADHAPRRCGEPEGDPAVAAAEFENQATSRHAIEDVRDLRFEILLHPRRRDLVDPPQSLAGQSSGVVAAHAATPEIRSGLISVPAMRL